MAGDLHGRARDRGQVDPVARLSVGPRERAQLPDDRRDPLGAPVGLVEQLDERAHARGVARALRQLARDPVEVEHHVPEGVVDLVRDAGGHRPDGGQPVGLDQLRLEHLARAHVAAHRQDGRLPLELAKSAAHLELDHGAVAPSHVIGGGRGPPSLEDELAAGPHRLGLVRRHQGVDRDLVELLHRREAGGLRVGLVREHEVPVADDAERLGGDLHQVAKVRLGAQPGALGVLARGHVDHEGEHRRAPFDGRRGRRDLDGDALAVAPDQIELVRLVALLALRPSPEALAKGGQVFGRHDPERVSFHQLLGGPAHDLGGRVVDVDAARRGRLDQRHRDADPGGPRGLQDGMTERVDLNARGQIAGVLPHWNLRVAAREGLRQAGLSFA